MGGDDGGALADLIDRLPRAYATMESQPQKVIDLMVQQFLQTPERSAELAELIGVADFLPLPGDLLEPQQRLADLFAAQGRIPATVDVTPAFDGRFNEVVAAAQEDA